MTDLQHIDIQLVMLNMLKEYNSKYLEQDQSLDKLVKEAADKVKVIVEKG